jgi:hypothetical protein
MEKVTVTIKNGEQSLQFRSFLGPALDSPEPGDVTHWNERCRSLADDLNSLLESGGLNQELGQDVTQYRVYQISTARAAKNLPLVGG